MVDPHARADSSPSSFEDVHRRFAAVVHGIALSHVGPDEVDDVLQEVFLTVHRRLQEVRDPGAVAGWVCAIARNTAIDHLRRRRRRPEPRETMATVQSPLRELDEGEFGRRVLERIASLPAAYRETLTLRLVEGMSGPTIAERTGLTHGSVRVNLCRGMALLRELLGEDGWP
jgi:RNA polymerase sigma-70 factor (ECF subfamily)